jgi:single-strand DNA-binding protein
MEHEAVNFNRTIVAGRLTRDPVVRYTPSGAAVAEIGLAINRVWTDKQTNTRKEETTFVDVTLWSRDAEVAGEYLAKGSSVLIGGRLQLDTWDDKQTGQKRTKLRVVAERMQMIGGRGEGGPAADRQPETTANGAPPIGFDAVPTGPPPDDEAPF